MKALTRVALETSITHWQENARAKKPEEAKISAPNCALCLRFQFDTDKLSSRSCGECPVGIKTGRSLCQGSPYEVASVAMQVWMTTNKDESGKLFRAAAKDEVRFLQSLLPKPKAKSPVAKRKLKPKARLMKRLG